MTDRRLRILYLVAGHGLMDGVGPSRNVLSLSRALRPYADVTLAFRYLLDPHAPADLPLIEIDPGSRPASSLDDSAMRGMSLGGFAGYLCRLRRLAVEAAGRYDVILEKSWLLSGHLSAVAAKAGGAGIPVENVVPSSARHEAAGLLKRLRVEAGRVLAGRALRQAPLVIAETDQLKTDIARVWGVEEGRIVVVGLGLDRGIFRPMPQDEARGRLGLPSDRCILLYVGTLDETHDLEAAVRAVAARDGDDLELHVVGDGPRRAEYEAIAAAGGGRIVFHGRLAHALVPVWIAAADLCLAPYSAKAFASGALGYSTMKIPEYLGVGRAVASVPSGRVRQIVTDGETGFLFDNTIARWQSFLDGRPDRARLAAMGEKAAAGPLPSWDDTARGYLAACERVLAGRGRGRN
ncbi:MAG TPA: glycosyltransferase [Geminicoccaceae bacterium]|nr:glycosyltransferase [Geminicoccus sp.]HMU49184.1 glycosyltransferase [Geminicoccaceae bacterium]